MLILNKWLIKSTQRYIILIDIKSLYRICLTKCLARSILKSKTDYDRPFGSYIKSLML